MFGHTQRKHLEASVEALTKEVAHYKKYIAQQEDETRKRVLSSSVALDFVAMKAFSVERLYRGMNDEVTNIGYLRSDGTVGEWVFYCNIEKHEQLVTWFNQYLESKPTQ